jgi:hypothetical protein
VFIVGAPESVDDRALTWVAVTGTGIHQLLEATSEAPELVEADLDVGQST